MRKSGEQGLGNRGQGEIINSIEKIMSNARPERPVGLSLRIIVYFSLVKTPISLYYIMYDSSSGQFDSKHNRFVSYFPVFSLSGINTLFFCLPTTIIKE